MRTAAPSVFGPRVHSYSRRPASSVICRVSDDDLAIQILPQLVEDFSVSLVSVLPTSFLSLSSSDTVASMRCCREGRPRMKPSFRGNGYDRLSGPDGSAVAVFPAGASPSLYLPCLVIGPYSGEHAAGRKQRCLLPVFPSHGRSFLFVFSRLSPFLSVCGRTE